MAADDVKPYFDVYLYIYSLLNRDDFEMFYDLLSLMSM